MSHEPAVFTIIMTDIHQIARITRAEVEVQKINGQTVIERVLVVCTILASGNNDLISPMYRKLSGRLSVT
jgi:hypothetical protein